MCAKLIAAVRRWLKIDAELFNCVGRINVIADHVMGLDARVDRVESFDMDVLSEVRAEIRLLGDRVSAIEGREDVWAAIVPHGQSLVGVECRGGFEGRSPKQVRIVLLAGDVDEASAVARLRRVYGPDATIVVPPPHEVVREEMPV